MPASRVATLASALMNSIEWAHFLEFIYQINQLCLTEIVLERVYKINCNVPSSSTNEASKNC